MAKRYYGLSRGQTEFDVDEDSSTTSNDVEVVFDLSKSYTKIELLNQLDMIKNRIIKDDFPPA